MLDDDFFTVFRIDKDEVERANVDLGMVESICAHYSEHKEAYGHAGRNIANLLQELKGVHSVRWRLKDPTHLAEKLIRKLSDLDLAEKYRDISVSNYSTIVTDLIGVRLLHIQRSDVDEIHQQITSDFDVSESAVAYVREGDSSLIQLYKDLGIEYRKHDMGYRSVHYVLKTRPQKEDLYVEVQVRTLYEEAWSEIDHLINYPAVSESQLVRAMLACINRLAGACDEFTSAVLAAESELEELHGSVEQRVQEIKAIVVERDQLIADKADLEEVNRKLDESLRSSISAQQSLSQFSPSMASRIASTAINPFSSALELSQRSLDSIVGRASLLALNPMSEYQAHQRMHGISGIAARMQSLQPNFPKPKFNDK